MQAGEGLRPAGKWREPALTKRMEMQPFQTLLARACLRDCSPKQAALPSSHGCTGRLTSGRHTGPRPERAAGDSRLSRAHRTLLLGWTAAPLLGATGRLYYSSCDLTRQSALGTVGLSFAEIQESRETAITIIIIIVITIATKIMPAKIHSLLCTRHCAKRLIFRQQERWVLFISIVQTRRLRLRGVSDSPAGTQLVSGRAGGLCRSA